MKMISLFSSGKQPHGLNVVNMKQSPVLFLRNTTSLTCIVVSCPSCPSLSIPILAVIRVMSSNPKMVVFAIDIFRLPHSLTFYTTKVVNGIWFHLGSICGIRFTTLRTYQCTFCPLFFKFGESTCYPMVYLFYLLAKQGTQLFASHFVVIIFKQLFVLFSPQIVPSVSCTTFGRAKLFGGTGFYGKWLFAIRALPYLLFNQYLATASDRAGGAYSTRGAIELFAKYFTSKLHFLYYIIKWQNIQINEQKWKTK